MARLRKLPVLPVALFAVWTVAVGYGLDVLWNYDATPGAQANAPSDWPSGLDRIAPELRPAGAPRYTLVMLAHPRCACTLASVDNLDRIAAQVDRRVQIITAFYEPSKDSGPDWERSRLVESVRSIPGAIVVMDPGGVIAHRFGASTSGQTLLYDPQGRLVFSGGITSARGHYGDSDGMDDVVSLVTTGRAQSNRAPVYGCALGGAARYELPATR